MWSNSLLRRRSDRLKPLKTHEESSDTRQWLESQWYLRCLKCAQIGGRAWIFRSERFDIAEFNVNAFYAGPFCARAEKPTPPSDDMRSVKCVSWTQKLHALSSAHIRSDYDALARSIAMQH